MNHQQNSGQLYIPSEAVTSDASSESSKMRLTQVKDYIVHMSPEGGSRYERAKKMAPQRGVISRVQIERYGLISAYVLNVSLPNADNPMGGNGVKRHEEIEKVLSSWCPDFGYADIREYCVCIYHWNMQAMTRPAIHVHVTRMMDAFGFFLALSLLSKKQYDLWVYKDDPNQIVPMRVGEAAFRISDTSSS